MLLQAFRHKISKNLHNHYLKGFSFSPEIQQEIGGFLYEHFYKNLKVDVKNPDIVVITLHSK